MIPATVLRFIDEKYGDTPIQLQEYPIISAIRFAAIVAGLTYTIDQSQRIGFSYGVNGDMAPAGRPGTLATLADTTIQNAGQTRDQADVFIYGMSFWLNPQSDASLIDAVMRETDVQIATNSDVLIPAGRLLDYPQPGGIYGAGQSAILEPSLLTPGLFNGGQGSQVPFPTNGNPTAGSFRRFDQPVFWSGLGNGPDSNLQIICTPRRTITRVAAVARPAAGLIAAYDPPPSAFVEGTWCLHAATVKRRGVNAG